MNTQEQRGPNPPPTPLRARAEARWRRLHPTLPQMSTAELQRVVYELQVHQIELEMQNEELRQAQAELTAARDRFSDLYDFAPAGYLTLDAKGMIREANLTMARLLGVARADLLNRSLSRFIARESQDAFYLHRQASHCPGQPLTCELVLRRADKSTLPVQLESLPFLDPVSKTCRSRAVLVDLTARHLADEALRASELRYRRLHESMTDAFVSVDMAGRILDFNPAYQRMLGYPPAELRRLSYLELTPPQWHDFEARIVQEQVLPHGYSGVYEKEYRRRDGTRFPVELRTFLIRDEQEQPVAMWAIVRDITERKQAQAALAASQAALLAANTQLQRTNDELERRVAARTAQLRKLAAELLHVEERERRRAADVLHEGLQQLLVSALYSLQGFKRWSRNRTFAKELEELTGCINDSINVTRTLSYELSPPGLHELGLTAALQWLAEWYERKYGLTVTVQAVNYPKSETEAVQIVLFRTARELLLNAAKHAQVKRVRIQLGRSPDGGVRMVVSDAGAGFEPAGLEAGSPGHEGSGLIRVRERLEMLGGSLSIQAAPGAGCRVTVTIPPAPKVAADQVAPAAVPTKSRRQAGRGPRAGRRSARTPRPTPPPVA